VRVIFILFLIVKHLLEGYNRPNDVAVGLVDVVGEAIEEVDGLSVAGVMLTTTPPARLRSHVH
jgi:hypothetical protein